MIFFFVQDAWAAVKKSFSGIILFIYYNLWLKGPRITCKGVLNPIYTNINYELIQIDKNNKFEEYIKIWEKILHSH